MSHDDSDGCSAGSDSAEQMFRRDLANSVRCERRLPWKEALALAAAGVVLLLRAVGFL